MKTKLVCQSSVTLALGGIYLCLEQVSIVETTGFWGKFSMKSHSAHIVRKSWLNMGLCDMKAWITACVRLVQLFSQRAVDS